MWDNLENIKALKTLIEDLEVKLNQTYRALKNAKERLNFYKHEEKIRTPEAVEENTDAILWTGINIDRLEEDKIKLENQLRLLKEIETN